MFVRPSGRKESELRKIVIERNYTRYAEGAVLVKFGHTAILCTASVEKTVPRWLKGQGKGWITAEYGMLPRATGERMQREATKGKQSGRTLEIQRLIGRSLRAAVDLKKLGENTIIVDCDVLQADGGTRTAAITGSCVALMDCIEKMQHEKIIKSNPFKQKVASVSVGIYNGKAILDLDYAEDSNAETDMNVVMLENGEFVEIQGTGENSTFSKKQMDEMLTLAESGISTLFSFQSAK